MDREQHLETQANNPWLTWLDTVTPEEFTALNRELERERAANPHKPLLKLEDLAFAVESFPARNPERAWELFLALGQSEFDEDRSLVASAMDQLAVSQQALIQQDSYRMEDVARLWCSLVVDDGEHGIVGDSAYSALARASHDERLSRGWFGVVALELATRANELNNGQAEPAHPYPAWRS